MQLMFARLSVSGVSRKLAAGLMFLLCVKEGTCSHRSCFSKLQIRICRGFLFRPPEEKMAQLLRKYGKCLQLTANMDRKGKVW